MSRCGKCRTRRMLVCVTRTPKLGPRSWVILLVNRDCPEDCFVVRRDLFLLDAKRLAAELAEYAGVPLMEVGASGAGKRRRA